MRVSVVVGRLSAVLCLWMLVLAGSAASEEPVKSGSDSQQPCEMHRNVQVTMKYLLYLPEDYESRPSWPLLLFLHGAGERGDDLDLVKKHGPPKLISEGKALPLVVVSPQCPSNRRWEPMELATLLDEVVERYRIDQQRIYVTGLSMGGFGTFALAAYQPQRLAAIVPICGGGEPIMARLISPVPAWVFHGAKDRVVPLSRSEQMVEALERAGGQVKFTVYPDAEHDSWTETYANPELYEWLLSQRRGQ